MLIQQYRSFSRVPRFRLSPLLKDRKRLLNFYKYRKTMNNLPPTSYDPSESVPAQPIGRKQRLINLMKTTRESYVNATRSSPGSGSNSPEPTIPRDTDLIYYPTYTRMIKPDLYETNLRFAVKAPGNINSRKNKLIVSLCKQYLKTNNTPTSNIESQLSSWDNNNYTEDDLPSMDSEVSSVASSSNVNAQANDELNTLNQRLGGFLSRGIANQRIIIDFLQHDSLQSSHTVFHTTDARGDGTLLVQTLFRPLNVRITIDTPPDFHQVISHIYPCHLIKPNGIGVISDIDDTIKHTGVTGDKKSMFRNVFVTDWKDWVVEGIPRWYYTLSTQCNVNFFYVSNSPLQLYQTLQDYVLNTLPNGPLFLKQYSGNMFASIMTSSANRKTQSISQILDDYPQKKFFLVGDSGEQDFEAYINMTLKYPEQILGIYIRCCKNSMSDMGLKEKEVMDQLNEIITQEYVQPVTTIAPMNTRNRPPPPPIVPSSYVHLSKSQSDMILQSKESIHSDMIPPPLPKRPVTDSEINKDYFIPSSQDDSNTYDDYFDKRADAWKKRVLEGVRQLNEINSFNIGLMFFDDPQKAQIQTTNIVQNVR